MQAKHVHLKNEEILYVSTDDGGVLKVVSARDNTGIQVAFYASPGCDSSLHPGDHSKIVIDYLEKQMELDLG